MSRVGKKPVPVPSGVTATVDGQTVKVKGAKGELQFLAPDEVSVCSSKTAPITVDAARRDQARPRRCGACPARRSRTSSKA